MASSSGIATSSLSGLTDEELQALERQLSQAPKSSSNTTHVPGTDPRAPGTVDPPIPVEMAPLPDLSEMPEDQLRALERQRANDNPNMSGWEDTGRSIVSGLQQGVGSLLGQFGDLRQISDATPDFLRSHGMKGLGDAVGAYTDFTNKANRSVGLDSRVFPTGAEVNKGIESVTGPFHKPQGTVAKHANTISQFAPNALAPGGPLARLASVVVPGVLSESAGQITDGTKAEPWARTVGALLGGAGVGAGRGVARSPERLVGEASRGASEADLTSAGLLMSDAQARGLQLTWPEALQQVTNNGTGAGRLQRVIEGTKQGQERLAPMFAERPQQVRGAVMDFADRVAAPSANPSMIGVRGQRAGQGGLDAVRKDINDQAAPYYDALEGQEMDLLKFGVLETNPSFQAALDAVRSHPELGPLIAHLPDNNMHVLNEVSKQLDTGATAARQTVQNPSGNNRLAGVRGNAKEATDNLAGLDSTDYSTARAMVANNREAFLDPLEAGPLGKVAATDQVPAQTAALYPSAPLEGAPSETAEALRLLGQADPGIGADLTRQHVVNTFNESSQALQPGPNQWGGAKFAANIAGNPEQRATLQSGLDVVAPAAASDLDPLLNALMATGKRQQPGSMTAFNSQDIQGMGQGGGSLSRLGSPSQWLDTAGNAIKDFQYRRNVDALAETLQLPPEEAAALLTRAQQGADNQILARMLLLNAGAGAGQ